MSNWNRIQEVIEYLSLNVNSFAKEIGLNRAERLYQIKRGNYAISKNLVSIIVERYPEINEVWLITGEGKMLKESSNTIKIPLYNLSLDNFSSDFKEPQLIEELEIPILSGSDFAFIHKGDSMVPEIESGSVVFVKRVDADSVILGDIYLVVSEKFSVVRFVRSAEDNSWRLVPKNVDSFDEIYLDKSDVKDIFKVKGVLSMITS